MDLKGAIFDLDGVIVNTVPIHFKAWKRMFSEYGKKFTFKDYIKKVDGIPRIDGAKAILTDLSDEEIQKASSKKQEYFLEFLKKEKIPVFESTVELIKQIKINNIKTSVISSSKNCHYILGKAGLLSLFNTEINGNDITKGKPDPQIFLLAAKNLNLQNNECIVFEDAVLGVEAAKNAGMFCIGIDRHSENLKESNLKKADHIVKDLKEINVNKLKSLIKNI